MRKLFFVINPTAGQGQAMKLIPEIEAICQVAGADYEIYETKARGDAERFVRQRCEEHETRAASREDPDTVLRFYACGGDGTLNEVVNGAAEYGFTEIGCIPAGTGNDFIRNFPEGSFDDPVRQIGGKACLCDLIRYEGICGGQAVSRYCVNMFNIGFDCNVVDMTDRMKRLPLMTGTTAYLASITAMLIEKKGADLLVEYDDGTIYDGRLLLISIANGICCGGGIKGLPRAVTDDGLFDVSLVKNVSRHVFVRLFPKYMKGTHLEDKRLADVLRYTHERRLRILPNRGEMKLCVDGEITEAGAVTFTMCPKKFRFIIPK